MQHGDGQARTQSCGHTFQKQVELFRSVVDGRINVRKSEKEHSKRQQVKVGTEGMHYLEKKLKGCEIMMQKVMKVNVVVLNIVACFIRVA